MGWFASQLPKRTPQIGRFDSDRGVWRADCVELMKTPTNDRTASSSERSSRQVRIVRIVWI
jgi:hypothetical protein